MWATRQRPTFLLLFVYDKGNLVGNTYIKLLFCVAKSAPLKSHYAPPSISIESDYFGSRLTNSQKMKVKIPHNCRLC